MKQNYGVNTYLAPQPVMIIGTYDADGNANAMMAVWGGIVGYDEIIVDLADHKTTENLKVNPYFTVHIADAAHVIASDYVGIVSGKKFPDKLEKAGFTTVKSDMVNAPIINELPLVLECELKEIINNSKYLGKIVNVKADESIIGGDGRLSMELLRPIVYDPFHYGYYVVGDRVGNAFHDGNFIKNRD